MQPTADEQVQFLRNIQRLLGEGLFVATYKYALLLALADICVEHGDDSGCPLVVPTTLIAEKFISYYWRQTLPYVARATTHPSSLVLRQNTGKPAAVVRLVENARNCIEPSLLKCASRHEREWTRLVLRVDAVIRRMPLWKLQTVGRATLDFLYANRKHGTLIELRAGVAFCFRQFYGLIGDLVRGAWVRYVRELNEEQLGTTGDLADFLFGVDRTGLAAVRPVLEELQHGNCFYCRGAITKGAGQVDHFIAWSRYPLDLGHNFVLAHATCNAAKADHLAATEHLESWVDRNSKYGDQLTDGFAQRDIRHDLATSAQVTRWAYSVVQMVGGLAWVRKDELAPLGTSWESVLAGLHMPSPASV